MTPIILNLRAPYSDVDRTVHQFNLILTKSLLGDNMNVDDDEIDDDNDDEDFDDWDWQEQKGG